MELQGTGEDVILFDAGTGIRAAGRDLLLRTAGKPLRVHLLLTHFHWDHIQGLPFFAPLFQAATHITIYSSGFSAKLRDALAGQMTAPYFPVAFDSVAARVDLVDLGPLKTSIGPMEVTPVEVSHPQGACAYSVEVGGTRFLYAPDREHGDARLDAILREAARGVPMLVADAQYTPEEYGSHLGWGHTTWAECARVAVEADVGTLVLFSHDPSHSDEQMHQIERDARVLFPRTFAAREEWAVEL